MSISSHIYLPSLIEGGYLPSSKRRNHVNRISNMSCPLTTGQVGLFNPLQFSNNTTTIVSNKGVVIEKESKYFPITPRVDCYIPHYLVVYGSWSVLYDPSLVKIAVTGSRVCGVGVSKDIREYIEKVYAVFGSRVLFITGGARGVDSIVEESAINLGAKLLVVLPKISLGYLDTVSRLKSVTVISLLAGSLLVTEKMFLKRNWVIAGLSHILFQMKAGLRSGSMSCSNYAAKFGRQVYVNDRFVPGEVGFLGNQDLLCRGCESIDYCINKLANYSLGV